MNPSTQNPTAASVQDQNDTQTQNSARAPTGPSTSGKDLRFQPEESALGKDPWIEDSDRHSQYSLKDCYYALDKRGRDQTLYRVPDANLFGISEVGHFPRGTTWETHHEPLSADGSKVDVCEVQSYASPVDAELGRPSVVTYHAQFTKEPTDTIPPSEPAVTVGGPEQQADGDRA